MRTVNLADCGSRVLKRKHKNIDLERRDYAVLCDHLANSFKMAANFNPEVVMSDSDKYRVSLVPMYQFLAKYAQIAFEKEFEQQLMSGLLIEESKPADGVVSISFKYYSALKNERYRLTFHAPNAPITTAWPQSMVKHGAHHSIVDRFESV